ncbi:hypothetical protein [Stenoxybacter acetivorans]|uniref:hypothetical protein n=1 Tax=Stenoxybacter acetivorans TaxID=422441 RepID=UPI00056BE142|nr:hypothetical protein [Stenoxybacter acetivorans]
MKLIIKEESKRDKIYNRFFLLVLLLAFAPWIITFLAGLIDLLSGVLLNCRLSSKSDDECVILDWHTASTFEHLVFGSFIVVFFTVPIGFFILIIGILHIRFSK